MKKAFLFLFLASAVFAEKPPFHVKDPATYNDLLDVNNKMGNVVHKTGAETIQGNKTFTGTTVFSTASATSFSASTATFAYSVYMATSSGKVGIGTSSPTEFLDVRGAGTTYSFSASTSSTGSPVALAVTNAGGTQIKKFLTIGSSGNSIDVLSMNRNSETGAIPTSTRGGYSWVSDSNGIHLESYNSSGGAVDANTIAVASSTASIGLGTQTPSARLEVKGNNKNVLIGDACGASGFAGIGFAAFSGCTNYSLLGDGSNTYINTPSGGFVSIRESNNEKIKVTTSNIHLFPSGTPDVQLEVSNGASTGGGTVHAASFAAHSSRTLKSDITYLTPADEISLYNDLKTLKPALFRYLANGVPDPTSPLRRGLILEDVPASLRQPNDPEAISLNDQVFLLQAAVQVLIGKVEALEGKVNPPVPAGQ